MHNEKHYLAMRNNLAMIYVQRSIFDMAFVSNIKFS